MGDAPALVIACNDGRRADGLPAHDGDIFGNVLPAMWSFMLAARARGLGTAWTTLHLMMEQAVADVLGIPFDRCSRRACRRWRSPWAPTSSRRPARADSIIHWDQW